MPRVYLIAVGGASCSGKTTLAKHLRSILSPTDSPTSARILHQDDFAPPADLIPLHPIHGVQDWDSVEGAIDWECQRRVLRGLKRTGEFEDGYKSHDALNEQIPVPISVEVERRWRERFETLVKEQEREKEGREKVVFVLADGFLMLCDAPSVELFDVKLFVREDRTTLKRRRDDRNGYHTATQSDVPAGELWTDPPNYWENIVYPAYLAAHEPLFVDGDVTRGKMIDEEVTILEASQLSMEAMVERACEKIYDVVSRFK